MKKYICDVCGWVFDEDTRAELGFDANVEFVDLPDDFECPLCRVGKEDFSELE